MSRTYKIIGWLVAVAALSVWMWGYGDGAKFNPVTGLDLHLSVVVAFLLLISLIVLGYVVFQSRRWALAVAGVVGLTFMFMLGWTWLDLLAVGFFFLFNAWSAKRVKQEIHERRILNIPDAFYHGLTPIVLGLFLMVSFAAYQSPLLDQIKSAKQLPGQVEVLFQQVVDNTIGQKIQAPPGQRQQLISEISSQTFQEFNSILKPYFQYAPPVLAFALFLILWGLSFIFIWLGIGVGMIMYWLAKKAGLVRIETKTTEIEVLIA